MNSEVLDLSKVSDRPRQELRVAPVAEMNPSQMLAIAVQRGTDMDQLSKLMDLQERWEKNQARKAFEAAIAMAKSEIKPVQKKREVDFTSQKGRTHYMYEDLALIANEVDPILAKYGLSYRYRSQQDAKHLSVTCVVAHRDGHSEETTLSADNDESGNKNSIQAIASAATYLQRYTLKLALGLSASKDDDARGAMPAGPVISESQIADLEALITEHGGNKSRLFKHLKINSLAEIPAANFKFVVEEIKSLAAARERARERT